MREFVAPVARGEHLPGAERISPKMQVHHNQSLELPAPSAAPFASAPVQSTSRRRLIAMPSLEPDVPHDANAHQRSLLGAVDTEVEASGEPWFGYDVKYKPQIQRTYGNFTPRYVGLRNQVLGGLLLQQVRELFFYPLAQRVALLNGSCSWSCRPACAYRAVVCLRIFT